MRPLKLKMTAFGPYRETETVDFEKLKDRNLFLITGSTGAGKTTIFDAITFALYGSGNGDERKPQNFRSDFADADVETEVELSFKVGEKVYNIVRCPAQPVKKKRGEGYRDESEKVVLEYKDRDGDDVVYDKIKEVNEKVESLLSLSVKQFRQIMMIPQGQFREVITSDTSAREETLRTIFDTDRYVKIQEALKARKKELDQSMKEAFAYIDSELLKLEKDIEGETTEKLLEEIEADIEIFEGDIADAEKKIAEMNEQIKALGSEIAVGEQRERLLKSIELNSEKLEALEREREIYTFEKIRIVKAEKAIRLAGEDKVCRELEKKRDDLELKVKLAKETLKKQEEDCKKKLELFNAQREREGERRKLAQRISELEESECRFQKLCTEEAKLKKYREEHDEIMEKLKNSAEYSAEKSKEIASLEEKLEDGKNTGVEIEKERRIIDALGQRRQGLLKAHSIRVKLDKADEELVQLKKAYDESEKELESQTIQFKTMESEYSDYYDAFIADQSLSIAEALEEGEPCPVCGSTHHPEKASGERRGITSNQLKEKREMLEQYREALDKTKIKRLKAENDMDSAEAEVKRLQGELDEKLLELEVGREEIYSVGQKIRGEIDDHSDKIERLEKSQEEQEKFREKLKKLKSEASTLEKAERENGEIERKLSDAVKESMLKLEGERAALSKLIDGDIDYEVFKSSLDSIKNRLSELEENYKTAEKEYDEAEKEKLKTSSVLEENSRELCSMKDELEDKLSEFKKRVIEEGFESEYDYREYSISKAEMEELSKRVESYFEEIKKLKTIIEEAEKSAEKLSIVDIELLKELQASDEAYREKLLEEKTKLSSRRDRHREARDSISQKLKEIGEEEKEYRTVGELSSVANAEKGGPNKKNMSFERYVLSSFLEDILVATNRRLKDMTDGRFEIFRKKSLDHRGKAGGLDLEVMDYYTGSRRDVTTLSGGEGFKASLSMALGLSDVVKSHAGGIELDTIFIDEGFGTLDSESLDMAIDTLVELQNSGRLVGIISHVEELKERIDAKLEIETGSDGSKIRDFEVRG